MDTFPGNAISFGDEVRQEIDGILTRLGRVLGRRLTLKGISESDGFLQVAEALLELARLHPQIEEPDRWLIEFLGIGPYDPEVIAQEIEEERQSSDADRRARAALAMRQVDLERQRKLWVERKGRPDAPRDISTHRPSRPRHPGSKPPRHFRPV
jgi:hypothetical protein